jgi:hypothetical protein
MEAPTKRARSPISSAQGAEAAEDPLDRSARRPQRRDEAPRLGIFLNEDRPHPLLGAILLEQNDEWTVERARYMTLETVAPLGDDLIAKLPAWPPGNPGQDRRPSMTAPPPLRHATGHDHRHRCTGRFSPTF